MRPVQITQSLATADDDGVAQNQTPGGAGNLTLNGALVSGGVAIFDNSRRVLVTTASDESGKTLTIFGTNRDGTPISVTMTGPNATTGQTDQDFFTVTRVAVSAAFTGNVKVGTNGVGSSKWILLDHFKTPFAIGLGCDVTGTVNYTVQHTFDNPHPHASSGNIAVPASYTLPTPFNHSSLAAQTTDADGNYAFPVQATRLLINSGTGSVLFTVSQAG
jgi:hypothetical protein